MKPYASNSTCTAKGKKSPQENTVSLPQMILSSAILLYSRFEVSFPLPHLPTTPAHVAVHLVDTAASPDLDPVFRLLHGQERAGQELRHRALIREAPAPEPGDWDADPSTNKSPTKPTRAEIIAELAALQPTHMTAARAGCSK